MFRLPTTAIQDFLHDQHHQVIISECEISVAALGILLWGMKRLSPRIAVVCADNLNVPHWLDSGKVKPGITCKILKKLLAWCVENGVGLIPRYIRSGHNLSADGLTRWSDQECEDWRAERDLTQCNIPDEWIEWGDYWSVWRHPSADHL